MQLFTRRSENWGSVALLCLPAAIAVALVFECTARVAWPAALVVVCFPAIYELSRRMKIRRLRSRVAADNAMTWTVFVNDVMVAKIQDTQYAQAQLEALLAPSNYIAQARNFLRVALATIGRVAILTPLMLVWALAIGAIVSPQDTAYVLAHASTLTTKDVASFGQLWTTISLLALVFAGAVFPFFGMDIGYVDHFDRDVHNRVRRFVGSKHPAISSGFLFFGVRAYVSTIRKRTRAHYFPRHSDRAHTAHLQHLVQVRAYRTMSPGRRLMFSRGDFAWSEPQCAAALD